MDSTHRYILGIVLYLGGCIIMALSPQMWFPIGVWGMIVGYRVMDKKYD